VVIRDKYRTEHVAWITVPPAPAWSAPAGPQQRERLPPPQITAALIGAIAVVVAALITSMPGFFRASGESPTQTMYSPVAGTLHKEETYDDLGTEVFRNPMGSAIARGPVSIPFGTQVLVKCWAPNESDMTSINAFYLVETSPWTGEYAPADAFLNADTSGALDPQVPKCQAT
jgi:hypothetical protein